MLLLTRNLFMVYLFAENTFLMTNKRGKKWKSKRKKLKSLRIDPQSILLPFESLLDKIAKIRCNLSLLTSSIHMSE